MIGDLNKLQRRKESGDISQIKKEMMLREEQKYQRYMSKITTEEIVERREDKYSPVFLNKLAERTGDLDLLQRVNANLDIKQE